MIAITNLWLSHKESACNTGDIGDKGSIPGLGRFPGGRNGNPLQCSCLGNSMDRGAWRATATGSLRVGHDWPQEHIINFKCESAGRSVMSLWPQGYSPPGSSVHGTFQARILESVVTPFSRGSSWPMDQTQVSCITGRFLTLWAPRELKEQI